MSEKRRKKGKRKSDVDLSDLLGLKIFGVEIGDLIKDIDGVRERLLAQRDELQKKFGEKVHVHFGIRVSGLDEREITYHRNRSIVDLLKERSEWRKRLPTITITKEDVKKAKEELEKEKRREEEGEKDKA